jgi:crossover junction endodeoxyribonuclease RusA
MLLAKPARDYRDAVSAVTLQNGVLTLTGPLDVAVVACPPDGKLRDIDNVAKSLLDAMRVGKVYRDDSQVRRLRLEWGPVTPGGRAVVCVGRYEPDGNLILALAERVYQLDHGCGTPPGPGTQGRSLEDGRGAIALNPRHI